MKTCDESVLYKVQILIFSTSKRAVGEIGRRIEFKPLRVNLISVQVRYGTFICKPIICNETKQIFRSIHDASKWCGLKSTKSIIDYFINSEHRKSAGKHPITGEKLTWSYL